ncbi:hypothetical protein HDZ31DRAFT_41589 [Schizophyllum fasciatum]
MDAPLLPPPPDDMLVIEYSRSNLEVCMRQEIKRAPYLWIGLLLHFLRSPSCRQGSAAGDSEFIASAKAEVATAVEELKRRENCNDFIAGWTLGNSYRRLWKEHQGYGENLSPTILSWVDEWEARQWGIPEEETLRVVFHVGGDLAKTLALECKAFDDVFTPANIMRRLVCEGIEPSVTSVHTRLPNNAALEVSWFEAIPVPAPPFKRELQFELHGRGWRHASRNVIPPRPTGHSLLLAFFNILSDNPIYVQAPILEGGWILLDYARQALRARGIRLPKGCIVMRRSVVNPSCLIEANMGDPIALPSKAPPFLTFHILCGKCARMEPFRTLSARHHFCNAP